MINLKKTNVRVVTYVTKDIHEAVGQLQKREGRRGESEMIRHMIEEYIRQAGILIEED